MTYKMFDVVSVPFPFTDGPQTKRRPALVLSSHTVFNDAIEHSVMAMITSAKNTAWPLDMPITDLSQAGLSSISVVRMKLFTLDHRFVCQKIGALSLQDRTSLKHVLQTLLPF